MNSYDELLQLGFRLEEMGGGCSALTRQYPDGSQHVITLADAPSAPSPETPAQTEVRVGFYAKGDEEPSADDYTAKLMHVVYEFLNAQV